MALNDSEIIEAKSREIKRLHGVCRIKDSYIENLVMHLKNLIVKVDENNSLSREYREQLNALISESEDVIG